MRHHTRDDRLQRTIFPVTVTYTVEPVDGGIGVAALLDEVFFFGLFAGYSRARRDPPRPAY